MKKWFRFLSMLVFVCILVSSAFSVSAQDIKSTQLKDGQAITLQVEDLMNVSEPHNSAWVGGGHPEPLIIYHSGNKTVSESIPKVYISNTTYQSKDILFGSGYNGCFIGTAFNNDERRHQFALGSTSKPMIDEDGGLSNSIKLLQDGKVAAINSSYTINIYDMKNSAIPFKLNISWGEDLNTNPNGRSHYEFFVVDINYSPTTDCYTLIYGRSAYVDGGAAGNKNCKLGVVVLDSDGNKVKSFKLGGLYREQLRDSTEVYNLYIGAIDWQVTFRDSFYDAQNASILYVSELRTKSDLENYSEFRKRPTRYHAINLEAGTYREITKSEFNAKKNELYNFPVEFKYQKEGTYIFDKTNPNEKPLFYEGIYVPVAFSFLEDGSVKVIISKSVLTQLTDTISVPGSWLE